jgi:hypothetical protein
MNDSTTLPQRLYLLAYDTLSRTKIGSGRRWTHPRSSAPGRPSTPVSVTRLVVAMARQNPRWGHG